MRINKYIVIYFIIAFSFVSCNAENDNFTPKTNYITWNSFKVKWKIDEKKYR
jgi:hypothetical protein